MPLSPKQVYKNPYLSGTFSYPADQRDIEDGRAEEIEPVSPLKVGSSQPADEAVAFWPHENSAGESETKSSGRVSGARSEASNLKPDDEKRRLEEEAAENARREADAALEKRVEQCLREGYEQGMAKAEDECRSMRENASARFREAELCLREAKQQAREIIAASERKIVELAVAVAERLIRDRLDQDPGTVLNIARETLNILNGGEQVELYVNSADLEACRAYSGNLREEFREILRLEVLTDDTIPRGSCRVESESGVAEYFIEDEKEQLKAKLLGIARRDEAEQIKEEDSVYGRH